MTARTEAKLATAGAAPPTVKAKEAVVEYLMFGVIVGQIAVLVFLGAMLWILLK